MVRYEKCPRCDLNYIDAEKQEYCDVCIAEMKGNTLQFADLDDEDYEELDAELGQDEICPICGVNPIHSGEKMCESCRQQQNEYDDEEEVDIDKDEEWKNYLDEENDGDMTMDETLQEELDAELSDDEEESDEYYDGEVDPLSELEDDDYFDEDDEDDDDDDDDDDEEEDDF